MPYLFSLTNEQKIAFGTALLAWFAQHGRHDLPWQCQRTPYRVWVSEIMLQQTRVETVIPYFLHFCSSFPEVRELAAASVDEVLYHWTGLGYYARARNLHRAARLMCEHHHAQLPAEWHKLCDLPGIGRSTAGAILALAYDQRHAILDGNVKRVLCRYHAISGWPGVKAVENTLWQLAEAYTPNHHTAAYTQAMMDLGATVCTRTKPHCQNCPLQNDCAAYRSQTTSVYPTPRPRKTLPVRQTTMLMLQNANHEVWLQQRPPRGIWGGLWSFPEYSNATQAVNWCRQHLGLEIVSCQTWPVVHHTFTHFHLEITPLHLYAPASLEKSTDDGNLWYNFTCAFACGLPAPVARLLQQLHDANLGAST